MLDGTAMGDRLKNARELCGLTQKQVAGKIGVDRNTIWRWEAGDRRFTKHFEELAMLLRCDPYWLLTGKRLKRTS